MMRGACVLVLLGSLECRGREIPIDCYEPCKGGNCRFSSCSEPAYCPGGLCYFYDCVRPTCDGGACTCACVQALFVRSRALA